MKINHILRFLPSSKRITIGGRHYIYDSYRQKNVSASPEEIVRQKVLSYIRWVLRTPAQCIQVEVHMSQYGFINNKERADIIILRPDKLRILAVVECKAKYIPISEEVRQQTLRYANALNSDYAFAVNGLEIEGFVFSSKKSQYLPMKQILSYRNMCRQYKNSKSQRRTLKNRAEFNQLFDLKYVRKQYSDYIGQDTRDELLPLLANLCDCLIDIKYRMKPKTYPYFKLIEDLGVRTQAVKVPGGGIFNNDNCRMFDIMDKYGNHSNIGLSFSPYYTTGSASSRTVLAVYRNDGIIGHHALQLVADTNFHCEIKDKFVITHKGRINVGRQGSAKINDVLSYVKAEKPDLIGEIGCVDLGVLHNHSLFNLQTPEFESFFEKLISYVLILEAYRNQQKHMTTFVQGPHE